MSTNTVRKEVLQSDFEIDRNSAAIVDEFDRFFSDVAKPTAPAAVKPAPAMPAPVSATIVQPGLAVPTPVAAVPSQPYNDPLMAELARIVGQGPAAKAAPAAPAPPPARTVDPLAAFEEELRRFDALHRAATVAPARKAAPAAVAPPVADRIEPSFAPAAAASGEAPPELRGLQPEPALTPAPQPMAMPPQEDDYYQEPAPEAAAVVRPRSRKVVMLLGSAAAIAVVGVVGAVTMNGSKRLSGEPPVIAAKTQPMKEKPTDPGGVEIPGQDRQVLARGATDAPKGPATVVNREEQPVDLNQTPKREVARVILPPPTGSAAGGATAATPIIMPPPASVNVPAAAPQTTPPRPETPAIAGGFEAKRVRSVRVGPEGEPVAAPPPASVAPVAATPVAATPVASTSVASTSVTAPAAPKPATPAAAPKPQSAAATSPAPKSEARPTIPRAPTTPVRTAARPAETADDAGAGSGPLSLRPPAGASPTRAVATSAPTTTASTGGSGGFAVQLAASPNEAEARSTAARLKQRYSALSNYNPTWRSSDVNGRTVYRVRVGGLSRDAANTLCGQIKSGGGSCFVAGN